jgi:hypothetical protein
MDYYSSYYIFFIIFFLFLYYYIYPSHHKLTTHAWLTSLNCSCSTGSPACQRLCPWTPGCILTSDLPSLHIFLSIIMFFPLVCFSVIVFCPLVYFSCYYILLVHFFPLLYICSIIVFFPLVYFSSYYNFPVSIFFSAVWSYFSPFPVITILSLMYHSLSYFISLYYYI